MALNSASKSAIIQDYGRGPGDTGSPEVQVALLSARINDLSDHFRTHARDNHSRQGLLRMVNSRRRLLDYLKRYDFDRYQKLIASLGLRK